MTGRVRSPAIGTGHSPYGCQTLKLAPGDGLIHSVRPRDDDEGAAETVLCRVGGIHPETSGRVWAASSTPLATVVVSVQVRT